MCFKWQKAGHRARKTDGCCSVGGIKFSNGDRGSANETQHLQQEHQDGRMSRLRSMIRFTVSRWWKTLPTEAIVGLQGRPMSNSRRSMAHMIMKDRMPGIRFLSQSKYFFFIQILYVLIFHSANIGQAGRNQVLWTLHYCWTLRSEMLESCKLRCYKQPSIEISPTTTVRYFDDHVQDEYFNTIFTFSSSF